MLVSRRQHPPAQSLKQRSGVVVGGGSARLYLQRARVVSHSSIIPPQPVIRKGSVVEGSAVPRIQLDCSSVVLESFFKPSLLADKELQSVF